MTCALESVVGARETLMTRYEEMRLVPAGQARGAGGAIGFTLLVRRGMATWMATCATQARACLAPAREPVQRLVPGDLNGDVAMILAEMALAAGFRSDVTT